MKFGIDAVRTGWHFMLILLFGPLVVLDSLARILVGKNMFGHAYFESLDVLIVPFVGKFTADVLVGLLELCLFAIFVKVTWRKIENE